MGTFAKCLTTEVILESMVVIVDSFTVSSRKLATEIYNLVLDKEAILSPVCSCIAGNVLVPVQRYMCYRNRP